MDKGVTDYFQRRLKKDDARILIIDEGGSSGSSPLGPRNQGGERINPGDTLGKAAMLISSAYSPDSKYIDAGIPQKENNFYRNFPNPFIGDELRPPLIPLKNLKSGI